MSGDMATTLMGTAQSKLKALEEAGAHIAKTFLDIPRILEKLKI